MKRLAYLAAVLGVLSLSGAGAQAADRTKVCFIYAGPVGDYGWSYQHDRGRLSVQRTFGPKVQVTYLESIAEGPQAERIMERFARSGCHIIFATSFGYMDQVNAVAARFPEVKFEHATGYERLHPNVSSYNSKFHEGRYVQGRIAGRMSETGVGGYIASFPIPEVIMGINAFVLGAQSVNPDFRLKVAWVNTWFDPQKEADAAKTLIDRGVDILTQHTDSTAPMQVATEHGIKAFGKASDMIRFGPKTQLTSVINKWSPYYIRRVKAVMDGTWEQADIWAGMHEGHIVMAPYTNMPADVAAMAAETERRIKNLDFNPFTGPINKQDGSPWLADGEVAEDGFLLGLNFYVEGVEDQLPQ